MYKNNYTHVRRFNWFISVWLRASEWMFSFWWFPLHYNRRVLLRLVFVIRLASKNHYALITQRLHNVTFRKPNKHLWFGWLKVNSNNKEPIVNHRRFSPEQSTSYIDLVETRGTKYRHRRRVRSPGITLFFPFKSCLLTCNGGKQNLHHRRLQRH